MTGIIQEPDGYGSKYTILLIPILFFFCFLMIKMIMQMIMHVVEEAKGKYEE
jgi:hypothetical protein